MAKRTIYKEWIFSVTLGEFGGFLIPSVLGALTVYFNLPQFAQTFVMIVAGLGEGAVLGFSQANVLKKYLPHFSRRRWIAATVTGAGLAWTIGMLPSTLSEQLLSTPLWVVIPLGIVLASTLLLSIGAFQYQVLKESLDGTRHWIWVTAISWLLGLMVAFGFIFAAPEGFFWTVAFSAAGGFGMALTMSVITGMYLKRLLKSRRV